MGGVPAGRIQSLFELVAALPVQDRIDNCDFLLATISVPREVRLGVAAIAAGWGQARLRLAEWRRMTRNQGGDLSFKLRSHSSGAQD